MVPRQKAVMELGAREISRMEERREEEADC